MSGVGCLDCGKPLSAGAARCRQHANALRNRSPEMRDQARRHMLARQASGISRNDAATAARLKSAYQDPVRRAALARAGAIGRANRTAEGSARGYAKQSATKQQQRERRLSWCPVDRRGEFHKLSKKFTTAEAKRIILADIAAQRRRKLAAMTPFERMQDAVARGVPLITMPDLRRADPAFTLGGVASGEFA